MESTVEIVEPGSGIVGEKRAAEQGADVVKEEGSPPKRARGGAERSLAGDVKKVAEMVLVLAAMGKMRGGKGPTAIEKELVEEARNRLVKVCEGFAPKDVFPRDAFGGVIEDLGLNKLKEQRLGFRPPKMSIAEKLLVSKRKMEKAEEFALPSTPHSSRLHPNSGAAVDSRSASHPVRMSQPDKSSHMSISSGSFQSASPSVHSSTVNSTSLPYQLPTSEIRPIGSSSLPSSHLSAATLPRVDRPHLRTDGRPDGSSHPAQLQVNYSANSTVRTPTWSVQPQSALSSKSGSDNMLPVNMSLRVEGAGGVKSGLAPHPSSRTVVAQTIGPPPLQGTTNHVQPPPAVNTHAEIGKIVQKLLQPRASERPTWNPPSRDYMNKALTCQMCMSTVTEIESILICDACEKGYHIRCLQTTNQKGVPKGEWHCGKCLSLSNGKPLPPKYGRVMRNVNTPKVSPNSAAVPSTSNKRVGALDENVGQPKIIGNGHNAMENTPTEVAGNNNGDQTSESERKESKVTQEIENGSSRVKMDNKVSSVIYPDNLMSNSSSATVSSVDSLVEKARVEKVELNPNSATVTSVDSLVEKRSVEKVEVNPISATVSSVDSLVEKTSVEEVETNPISATVSSVHSLVEKTSDEKVEVNPNSATISSVDSLVEKTSVEQEEVNPNTATVSSVGPLVEKTSVVKAELNPIFSAEVAMVPNSSGKSTPDAVKASPSNQSSENHCLVSDSKESHGNESSNNKNQLKEQGVVRDNPSTIVANAEPVNQGMSSSDGLHAVSWVGDPIQILDAKTYYASCCINGHLYRATDHVLIRFDNDKLIPSKLQAMWEDKHTSAKWVTVNQCYFPSDLPEAVGRPCGLESSEVYESTCGRILLAGLIESPCKVLSPRRFAEESERRNRLNQLNVHLPPLYVCKWIYDEAKGLFRDISC